MVLNRTADEDVLINVRFQIESARNKVQKELNQLKQQVAASSSGNEKKSLQKQIMTTRLKGQEQLLGMQEKMAKVNRDVNRAKTPFAGWALSVLFFGMALERVFTGIWKSGLSTFQDVMHSVRNTITQFDVLNGSVKFLQFSIGQALEPVVGYLLPIIDAMSQWINEHPELFRWITIIGIALGAIFTVGGAGVLALNGFIDLAMKMGLVSLGAEGMTLTMGPLGTAITAVGTALQGMVVFLATNPFVLLAAGAAAFLYVMVLLAEKFGGFTNAIKVMVSTFVMLIAFIVQTVANVILDFVNMSLRSIASMFSFAARIAKAAGLSTLSNQLAAVANDFKNLSNLHVDLLTPTAQLLDSIGLNPAPVSSQSTTIYDNKTVNVNINNPSSDDIKQVIASLNATR